MIYKILLLLAVAILVFVSVTFIILMTERKGRNWATFVSFSRTIIVITITYITFYLMFIR